MHWYSKRDKQTFFSRGTPLDTTRIIILVDNIWMVFKKKKKLLLIIYSPSDLGNVNSVSCAMTWPNCMTNKLCLIEILSLLLKTVVRIFLESGNSRPEIAFLRSLMPMKTFVAYVLCVSFRYENYTYVSGVLKIILFFF